MDRTGSRILVPTSAAGALPTAPEHFMDRRRLLGATLALGVAAIASPMAALAAEEAPGFDPAGPMPTPDQILGPFYPVRKPTDGHADLTRLAGRPGMALGPVVHVMGRVLSVRGEPAPGVRLEIWQANAAGKYTHPHDRNTAPIDPNFDGYATVVTDNEGRFRFKTVKPGAYPVVPGYSRPPHIHFDVTGRYNRLVTQMYFPGEPLNERDPLLQQSWAKESLIAKVLPPTKEEEPDSQLVVWNIVLIQG
ncbi:MAG: protocatechuate 3,4-dioxygenase [Betaproteobacteria bacterium]|nr:protocatechuate 3,4-dioxygenase [Betaproteobacteria bacterium]